MNKNAIWSIVLVLLILGSIIGASIGSRNRDNLTPETPINRPDIPIDFYTAEVKASVLENPENNLIMIAESQEFDALKIEQDFLKIKGIKQINTEFKKQDEKIILVARMLIEGKETKKIMQEISEINYLSSENKEFYRQGSISLKESVLFQNPDENKELNYDFVDYRVDSILWETTQKDDEIEGVLQAYFQEEAIVEIFFLETNNITNSPYLIFDNISLEQPEWVEEYRVSTEGNYDKYVSEQKIIENLNPQEIEQDIQETIIFLKQDFEEQDINSEVILDVVKEEDEVKIYLKPDISYEEYLEALEELEKIGLALQDLQAPLVVNYTLYFNEILENLEALLENLHLSLENIEKKAIFEKEIMEIQGKEYTYPDKVLEIWLEYPEDLEINEVEVFVQGIARKQEILSMGGVKANLDFDIEDKDTDLEDEA